MLLINLFACKSCVWLGRLEENESVDSRERSHLEFQHYVVMQQKQLNLVFDFCLKLSRHYLFCFGSNEHTSKPFFGVELYFRLYNFGLLNIGLH